MADIEAKTPTALETTSASDVDKPELDADDIYIDPQHERKVLWKCDAFLMPLLTLSFLAAYLDRSNIGNAAIAGMPEDLNMNDQQWSNAILFFYVTYVPFELPGSLLVKKIKPSRLLPAFMLMFAVVCFSVGWMHTAGQLYAARLLIGLAEAGMYPALGITLTTFYTPVEQARRFAYLYISVGLSGAFGGLFAYALLQLDGAHGIAGWRWLFIVEGVLSVGIAALLWAAMPDTYANAKFLTPADKELMRLRTIKHDRYMRTDENFSRHEVVRAFQDPKVYIGGLIQFLGDVLSFGSSTFMPSIVRSLGFPSLLTQLLTVPVFFVAVCLYIAVSWWSDKARQRSVFMISGALSLAVGFAMLVGVPMDQRGVLYFACFVCVPGIYIMLGINYVWMLGAHAGYYKRATAIGINLTMGNSAGLVIGQIYKDQTDDGRYLVGVSTSMACGIAAIFLILILRWYFARLNRIRDALAPEERQRWIDEGKTGDAHPDYRFLL